MVHISAGQQILPASRALGRAAGVQIRSIRRAGSPGCDIVISAADIGPDGQPA